MPTDDAPTTAYIKEDFVRVKHDGSDEVTVLAWGDPVEVGVYDPATNRTHVTVHGRTDKPFSGTVSGRLPTQARGVLQLSMVDVQQGDAMVLQSPLGRTVFIDSGENKLFARYAAARYRDTSPRDPLVVDAVVVSHGDADHCTGFNCMVESETDNRPEKRIFASPKRIYHNGLAKGPSNLKPDKIFGTTVATQSGTYVIDLADDPSSLTGARLNVSFQKWKQTIEHWRARDPAMTVGRLEAGMNNAFPFLKTEGIDVQVLGPITTPVNTQDGKRPGLPLLMEPPQTVELPLDIAVKAKARTFSAAQTINGHSIVLRIEYGNVRFLLAGDVNQQSMASLRRAFGPDALQCEVLKVPHHGSGDFDLATLRAFSPIVSLISSGDESSRTEYIHPRATLMAALGKVSRGDINVILCTELAAFFATRGVSIDVEKVKKYFGFERSSFGIIQVRTDGKRVLVFTHSGKENVFEAYRFEVDAAHNVKFAKDVKKR